MKVFLFSILALAFSFSAQTLVAQQAEQATVSPNSPPVLQIFINNASEPVKWYVEEKAISNEYGEAIVRTEGDAQATLTARLQVLQSDASVSDFEFSPSENKLSFSMAGKGREAVLRELETLIRQ